MKDDQLINDFAIRCFRNVADQDYILARMAYKAFLIPQFHWSSLQAIEKYLKAILLLNRIKAKDVNHDLEQALKHTKKLPFKINLSKSSKRFIHHINRFGRFRYTESSFVIEGPKLVELDKTVWEIRRYCKLLKYTIDLDDGTKKDMLQIQLQHIKNSEMKPANKFRLIGGLIEEIIDNKDHPARKPLIWQNAFFGSLSRKKVASPQHFQATNAPLTLHPEFLDEVRRYVYLPKDVIKAYNEELKRRSAGNADRS